MARSTNGQSLDQAADGTTEPDERAYRSLGMGTARRTRYAGAWRLWRPCIDRETPSTPCSTGVIGEHLETFLRAAANDRAALECLSRLRPPFAQERLRSRSDGRIALELKTAWHDGTRELVFEPLEFLGAFGGDDAAAGNQPAHLPRPAGPARPLARARGGLRTRPARVHGFGGGAVRRTRGHGGEEPAARLELGGSDAPGVCR